MYEIRHDWRDSDGDKLAIVQRWTSGWGLTIRRMANTSEVVSSDCVQVAVLVIDCFQHYSFRTAVCRPPWDICVARKRRSRSNFANNFKLNSIRGFPGAIHTRPLPLKLFKTSGTIQI